MALAKFSDWMMNEVGESLPTAGAEQASEEEVKRQLNQFNTNFDRLMTQIEKTPSINKKVVQTMMDQLITAILERAKGLSGMERTAMTRLGKAVQGARG